MTGSNTVCRFRAHSLEILIGSLGLHLPLPAAAGPANTATIYARTRSAGFGPEVKKRILLGTYALTAEYAPPVVIPAIFLIQCSAFDNYFLQAQRIRRLVRDDFNRVFRAPDVLSSSATSNKDGVDVLIHPSAIRTAPLLGARDTEGLETYVQDVLTVPASLAGLPALSVPLQTDSREWPVGVSVVGQWGCDDTVLQVGQFLENFK